MVSAARADNAAHPLGEFDCCLKKISTMTAQKGAVMPIRKRVWGPANRKRDTWVLDYYDQAGKLRHKAFKNRRDANFFLEKTQARIGQLNTVVNEDELNYTIHQRRLYGQTAEPLTVKAIIQIINKMWRTAAARICGSLMSPISFNRLGLGRSNCVMPAISPGMRQLMTHYGVQVRPT
jgi:hypothetical protein